MSNFQPLEVVGHGSETQLQVGENLNKTRFVLVGFEILRRNWIQCKNRAISNVKYFYISSDQLWLRRSQSWSELISKQLVTSQIPFLY